MKRRLPIGIQDFVSIREEGFCYVDKTERIHQSITGSGRAFFLSRPRWFGKSLLCLTEYLLPWDGSGKKLFKIGVVFDSEKHTIGDWKVE